MARARALAVVGMLAAATLLAVWILPSTVALSGGPDAYGYTFDDAVPYSWIPAAGIVVADNADNCQNPGGTPDFGFGTFTYYGVAYTDVLVCPNGFVKFTGATTTGLTASSTIPYTPIPNADIVALSASGLNPTLPGSGDIYFDEQPAATVVTWDLVNITGTVQVQFQIILRDTGVIDIQYNDVPAAYGTSPSGIESSLGDTGLQYSGFSLPPRIANGVTVRYTPPSPALVDTLTVTGEDHAPAALEQTATDVRMARYLLTAGSGAVAVKAVRLEKLGTIADAAVYLRLVNDTNDNAVYDPGIDTSVTGWTTPTGGVVAQSFNAPYVVKPGLPQRWIALAYCLCTAIPGSTLGVRVASALPSFDVAGIDAVAYSPGSPIDSSLSTVTSFPTSTLSATSLGRTRRGGGTGRCSQRPSVSRRAAIRRGARFSPPLASTAKAFASWMGVAAMPWPKAIVAWSTGRHSRQNRPPRVARQLPRHRSSFRAADPCTSQYAKDRPGVRETALARTGNPGSLAGAALVQ